MGRKVVVGVLVVASACGSAKAITEPPTPVPATVPTAELNTPVLAPTTTTTLAPEPTTVPAPTEYLQPVATTRPLPQTSTPYNGWAIPEYIVACETGGTFSWTAHNLSTDASGPYQIMPEWFGGELAMNQSHAAQHAMAARIWDNGRGASNWSQCL